MRSMWHNAKRSHVLQFIITSVTPRSVDVSPSVLRNVVAQTMTTSLTSRSLILSYSTQCVFECLDLGPSKFNGLQKSSIELPTISVLYE